MGKPTVTKNQIIEYLKENKPDAKFDRSDIKSAITALKGDASTMAGLGVASLLKMLNKKSPMAQTPPPGTLSKGPQEKRTNEKSYQDKIMKIAKENSKKDGGRVTGKKVAGRLAKRGYGKARR